MAETAGVKLGFLRNEISEMDSGEEFYREQARFSPIAGWVSVGDRIVSVNPAALELLGALQPSDVIGKAPSRFLRFGRLATLQGRAIPVNVTTRSTPYRGQPAEFSYFFRIAEPADGQRELAELEQLYATAPVGLAFTDTDHRYVRINQRLAECNGWPVPHHIGRTVREILPEMADNLEPLLDLVILAGEPVVGLEVSGVTAAHPGEEHHFLIHYYPVKNASGQVLGVSAVVQDITKIKLVEAEVRAANRRLETVIASIQDAFVMLDNDWRFTYANDHAAHLLQQPVEELPGKLWWDVLPDMGPSYAEDLLTAKSENRRARIESRLSQSGVWLEERDLLLRGWSLDSAARYHRSENGRAAEAREREHLPRDWGFDRLWSLDRRQRRADDLAERVLLEAAGLKGGTGFGFRIYASDAVRDGR